MHVFPKLGEFSNNERNYQCSGYNPLTSIPIAFVYLLYSTVRARRDMYALMHLYNLFYWMVKEVRVYWMSQSV